jgi:putative salt-induced outer membrane protein YdiY
MNQFNCELLCALQSAWETSRQVISALNYTEVLQTIPSPMKIRSFCLASLASVLPLSSYAGTLSVGKGGSAASSSSAVGSNSPWELTTAAGVFLTKGNSDNLNASIQVLASYLDDTTEAYIGADYFYGESNDVNVQDALHGFVTYTRNISGNLGFNLVADYLRNDPAQLDYRYQVVPGLAYTALSSETSKLVFDAGFGYVWEKQGSAEIEDFAWRVGQRFDTALSASTSFYQSLSYLASTGNSDDWWVTAEAGLKIALSEHWAVNTMVRYVHDNNPAAGAEEGDLSVMAGLSYSLAGFPTGAAPKVRRTLKPAKTAAAVPAMGWSSSAALGFSLAEGNAENMVLAGDISTAHRTASDEFLANLAGAYGEVSGVRSVQNARAGVQYNKTLSGNFYAGLGTSFITDDVAGIDYRITPAALLGLHVIKNDTTTLSIEGGPSFVFEEQGGMEESYFSLQAGEKLSHAISDTVRVGQNALFVTEAGDTGNYLLVANAFIEADISDALSTRITATEIYDATPAAGSKSSDFILSAGIAVKF